MRGGDHMTFITCDISPLLLRHQQPLQEQADASQSSRKYHPLYTSPLDPLRTARPKPTCTAIKSPSNPPQIACKSIKNQFCINKIPFLRRATKTPPLAPPLLIRAFTGWPLIGIPCTRDGTKGGRLQPCTLLALQSDLVSLQP
jgi:hypothetical protein